MFCEYSSQMGFYGVRPLRPPWASHFGQFLGPIKFYMHIYGILGSTFYPNFNIIKAQFIFQKKKGPSYFIALKFVFNVLKV